MATNDTIQHSLYTGTLREEATRLASEAGKQVHQLAGELKALYERIHGKVGSDLLDWHWQATTLQNKLRATGAMNTGPAPDSAAANTKGKGEPPISGVQGNALSEGKLAGGPSAKSTKVTDVPGSPSVAGEIKSDSVAKATAPKS